ncbi:MAG: hypothetical protein CMJ05_02720 [Pelagibacterales bacterium]|nr:hypothetical protein [Pelagibacterales bacterium]|tara:strand:- start:6199 stop:7263 length:1065 start_codon:yes stop_codon:yes gene_type:complete
MKLFNYIIYQISLIITSIGKIGFLNIFKYYDTKSINVILLYPSSFKGWINYFGRAFVLHDFSIIYSLVKSKKKYRFVFRSKFGILKNCNVYYSFSSLINDYDFDNHSEYLYFVINKIESLGNNLFPKPKEILLWENKVYMHKIFDKFNISCPKTIIIEKEKFNIKLIEKNFTYPFLIKEPFSNHSKGIYHIKNRENLINISKQSFKNVSTFLIQSLVNMTKDSRVVVVNSSINYSYWRSKKVTSTFNTTSTSNGSALDFTPLSKKNEKIIIDYTKKLNVSIAAYDVTFENDDTESKPIILEVSTSFLLNPIPTGRFLNQPYLKYKASPIKFARDRSKMFLDFKFNVLKKFINES